MSTSRRFLRDQVVWFEVEVTVEQISNDLKDPDDGFVVDVPAHFLFIKRNML